MNTKPIQHYPEPTSPALPAEVMDFLSALVDITNGNADINKRSIVRPGVTLKREASRLLKKFQTSK